MTSISATGSSSAWASVGNDRASRMQQRMFAKADTNGDGSVDKTELQTMLDKIADKTGGTALNADDVFSKMDSDGSGSLSSSELDAGMKSLMPAPSSTVSFAQQRGGGDDLFSKVDTNGDGSIDPAELSAMMAKGAGGSSSTTSTDSTGSTTASADSTALFKKLDTDGDGKISQSEFDAGKPQGAHGHHGMPPPMDDSSTGSTSDSASQIDSLMQQIAQAADANGDGTLSKSETDDLSTKINNAIDSMLQASQTSVGSTASSSGSSSSGSSDSTAQSQSQDGLAALLDKVLKQYAAGAASPASQAAGSSLLSASA